ncbi:hypothetical protein WAI453_012501 [Rhynchosporium graminicola]
MSSIDKPPTSSIKEIKSADEVAYMALNHKDLGLAGLAGSMWATPGVDYSLKKESGSLPSSSSEGKR